MAVITCWVKDKAQQLIKKKKKLNRQHETTYLFTPENRRSVKYTVPVLASP
jgi:hypothetical protein